MQAHEFAVRHFVDRIGQRFIKGDKVLDGVIVSNGSGRSRKGFFGFTISDVVSLAATEQVELSRPVVQKYLDGMAKQGELEFVHILVKGKNVYARVYKKNLSGGKSCE